MNLRHRILLTIEQNELAFWSLAERVLAWAARTGGPRLERELVGARAWASDAASVRREEIERWRLIVRAEATRDVAHRQDPNMGTNVRAASQRGILQQQPFSS